VHLGRDPLLVRAPRSTAKSAWRSERARSSSSIAFGFDSREAFASNTTRPRAGPVQPSIADHDVAGLAGAALEVPDRVAVVALADRDLVERGVHRLLERAALGGAALGLLRDGLGLLLLRPRALRARPRGPASARSSRAGGACCWSDVCFIAPSQARWKTANGLSSESAGELLAQVVPHHAHRLGERGLELVLHRAPTTPRRSAW
jgi:hypothetical protein